jgi:transcription termination/antitermination protein NusA
VKLSHVIEELVEEKGLDRTVLGDIMCEGMQAAYSKKYPHVIFDVHYNKKTDEIKVSAQKVVVATVTDEDRQISLRKARTIQPDIQVGEGIAVPFEGTIGRIEILRAKQLIAQKIRAVEAAAIYAEFKPKEGTLVHGVVHKCERNGTIVKLNNDTLAFLPKSLAIPEDKCSVGYTIRALLKEVLAEPYNENQLILDRVSPEFLEKLFEHEIPEVYEPSLKPPFERLVEIKKIARVAGYKSKVLVLSNDKNIDPVGTCVGLAGARIRPILRELGAEKVDIIKYTDDLEQLVRDALKPAQVNRVEVSSGNAYIWLDEDQRSFAIGKLGQNIALASQITGLSIHLVKSEGQAFVADETPTIDEQEE